MTREEVLTILTELTAAQDDPEGFYTTHELSEGAGVSLKTMRRWLRDISRAGRLERANVKGESLAGARIMVPAYRIIPEKSG